MSVELHALLREEPTLHPDLGALVDHALDAGFEVEVFSNLVHIPSRLWDTFSRPGVRLATSYYSADSGRHESITRRRGSHARTRVDIAESLDRAIPLRVGLIDLGSGSSAALDAFGVRDVGVDRVRGVGRGGMAERVRALDLARQCIGYGSRRRACSRDARVAGVDRSVVLAAGRWRVRP